MYKISQAWINKNFQELCVKHITKEMPASKEKWKETSLRKIKTDKDPGFNIFFFNDYYLFLWLVIPRLLFKIPKMCVSWKKNIWSWGQQLIGIQQLRRCFCFPYYYFYILYIFPESSAIFGTTDWNLWAQDIFQTMYITPWLRKTLGYSLD